MKRTNDPMNPVYRIGNPPRCGARNRQGAPCQAPAIRGKTRCRLHGGRSLAGREHPNYKHGNYTKEAFIERSEVTRLIKEYRRLMDHS